MKVLRVRPTDKSIFETRLSSEGPVNTNIPLGDMAAELIESFEMVVDIYNSSEELLPEKTIPIGDVHYDFIFSKFLMSELKKGVKIDSLLDLLNHSNNVVSNSIASNAHDPFKRAVENIAHDIVAKIEHDSFFDNYSPGNLTDFIEGKLLELKEKFNISSK